MTGFGRASFRVAGVSFDVEARSVNHRHLDVRARLPRVLSGLEADVRTRVQAHLARGKVDVSVVTPETGGPQARLEIDLDAAREYLRAADALRRGEGMAGEVEIPQLLGLPGVARFVEPVLPGEELAQALAEAVDAALGALDAMRAAEGGAIARDLEGRLARVRELAGAIEVRAGEVQHSVRERLRKRSEQLAQETGLLDEARLHQEIVLAADRLDVTEEIVRLRSHVEQFLAIVAEAGPGRPVGRRLEFLMQELLREANTIGSKGSDAPIAHQVVELKTELERVREQIQNVE